MKAWEDMTELEQAQCTYSDMHKDVYGFRPRYDISSWTLDRFNLEFKRLEDEMESVFASEREMEKEAIRLFEELVTKNIQLGAGDRETALKWIHDAEGTFGDNDYLTYRFALPYNYFTAEV